MDEQKIQEELWLHPEKTREQIAAEMAQKPVPMPAPVATPVSAPATAPSIQQATTPTTNQLQGTQQVVVDSQSPIYKRATNLAIISLVCHYAAPAVLLTIVGYTEDADIPDFIKVPLGSMLFASYIASWVLAITARAKCKANKFPTILLWIYGIEAAMNLLGVIIIIVFFMYLIATCSG